MVNEYTQILPSGAMPTQPLPRPVSDLGLKNVSRWKSSRVSHHAGRCCGATYSGGVFCVDEELLGAFHELLKHFGAPPHYAGQLLPLANQENQSRALAKTMTKTGITKPDGPITCKPSAIPSCSTAAR